MQYYANSQLLINQNELAKAGELLWGAIAEATKALHLIVKDEPISSHREIRMYLNSILIQEADKGRVKKQHVSAAHQLHINFYETDLFQHDESTFFEQYQYGNLLFGFLMDLVREHQVV
jgi:hypothetical protein